MRRGSKRHPELADEEKNFNKLTSTPHTLKSQHPKLRKGLIKEKRGKREIMRQAQLQPCPLRPHNSAKVGGLGSPRSLMVGYNSGRKKARKAALKGNPSQGIGL